MTAVGAAASDGNSGVAGAFAFFGFGLVDQFDTLIFEKDQYLIDFLGISVVIRQMVVDLIVG